MRISLNLASHPYVELGPIYQRLRLLIAVLAVLAVPLWFLLRTETQKAEAAHARLIAAQQSVAALQREQQTYQSDMRLPQNASVLRESQFLNGLFQRKAFSWTAVMMDLENVLPGGVQVENIEPVISRNGNVTIRLRVNGQHDRAVELIRNLEHSRRFLYPRLADESAASAQGGRGLEQVSAASGVNFDILADYNPLPPAGKTTPDRGPAKSGGKAASSLARAQAKKQSGRAPRAAASPGKAGAR